MRRQRLLVFAGKPVWTPTSTICIAQNELTEQTVTLIRNREYKQQICDFSSLRWGSICPTDIDLCVEFGGKLFVIAEAKFGDAQISKGQGLALERLTDAIHNPSKGIHAVAFLVSHKDSGDIDMGKTVVTKYRYNNRWQLPTNPNATLLDGINTFRQHLLGTK